jgi:PmbA protein
MKKTKEHWELFTYTKNTQQVKFLDNQLKNLNSKEFKGKVLRLVNNKKLGTAIGSIKTNLNDLIAKAKENSLYGREIKFNFYDQKLSAQNFNWVEKKTEKIAFVEMMDLGKKVVHQVNKAFPDFFVSVGLEKTKIEKSLTYSNQIEKAYQDEFFNWGVEIYKAQEGDILSVYDGTNEFLKERNLDSFLGCLFENLKLAKKIVPLEGKRYPVIIHPAAFQMMFAALLEGIRGNNVFRKISPLTGKLGEKVLNSEVTLFDDPLWKGGDLRTAFDDEGVGGKRKTIVEKGVLKTYLLNLEYAKELKLKPTGNGFRRNFLTGATELELAPLIFPTNLVMEKGKIPVKEMIKDIKQGVFIHFSWDCWQGNLINGNLSGNISMGYKIKNGKLEGRIKNMRFMTNIYEILGKNLLGLSKETPKNLFANSIFPYFLVKDVNIS